MRAAWGVVGVGAIVLAGLSVPTVASAEVVDGGVIAYGSGGVITVETAGTSETIATYDYEVDGTGDQLADLALSADGRVLAVQTFNAYDNPWTTTTTVLDTTTGATIATRSGQYTPVGYLIDVSPDGTDLLYTTQTDVVLEDIASGARTVLPGLGFQSALGYPIGFTPDGLRLVVNSSVGDETGSTDLYDIATGTSTVLLPGAPGIRTHATSISADGTVASVGYGECGDPISTSLHALDGSSAGTVGQPTLDSRIAFSPDGEELLFVRATAPMQTGCSGDSSEQPVQVLRADRGSASATPAFTAVAWDWAGTVVDEPGEPELQTPTRLSGVNRFATAVAIVQDAFPAGADTVYLVSGESFPDALSAGPAAAHEGAPVLLTMRDSLPGEVTAELVRLAPSRVVIVGGTAAVSDGVAAAVEAIGARPGATPIAVERLSGANRYATSALVAQTVFGTAELAYVAAGANFPDALAGGSAAGAFGAPILLVYGDALDAAGAGALGSLGVDAVRIVGGTASVSAGMATSIGQTGAAVARLSGPTRFETAVQVNQAFGTVDTAYVASGLSFPDALAGAAIAGAQGAPMYLTQASCLPQAVIDDIRRVGSPSVTILGGTAAVSPAVVAYASCG